MRMVCLFRVHHRKLGINTRNDGLENCPAEAVGEACYGEMSHDPALMVWKRQLLWNTVIFKIHLKFQLCTQNVSGIFPSHIIFVQEFHFCLFKVIFSSHHGIHHHGRIFVGVTFSIRIASTRKSVLSVRNAAEDGQWFASSPYTARHWALEGILESTRIVGRNAFEKVRVVLKNRTKSKRKDTICIYCIYPRHPKKTNTW